MARTSLTVEHIARIEGHGNVALSVEDGTVRSVEMNIVEPARLFESMARGRMFSDIPAIASRICGICSSSHVVTDILAIESALGVAVTERTQALRELLVYGSYLQNHATHLFVFAAPDYVGETSIFPLAQTDPDLFQGALGIKALGNELCTTVGGRSVHPITAVVGGFTDEIAADEYRRLAERMDEAAAFAARAVGLFHDFGVPPIETRGDLLAMVEDGYYPVECSDTARFLDAGIEFDANEVGAQVEEYAVGHSAALLARVRATGTPYFTGALARVNASWQHLGQNAKVAAAKAGLRPPERNPFMNNVAQAVVLVDALDRCAALCRRLAEPGGIEGTSAPVAFRYARAGLRGGLHRGPGAARCSTCWRWTAKAAWRAPPSSRPRPRTSRTWKPTCAFWPRCWWTKAAGKTSSAWKWKSLCAPTTPASAAACIRVPAAGQPPEPADAGNGLTLRGLTALCLGARGPRYA